MANTITIRLEPHGDIVDADDYTGLTADAYTELMNALSAFGFDIDIVAGVE